MTARSLLSWWLTNILTQLASTKILWQTSSVGPASPTRTWPVHLSLNWSERAGPMGRRGWTLGLIWMGLIRTSVKSGPRIRGNGTVHWTSSLRLLMGWLLKILRTLAIFCLRMRGWWRGCLGRQGGNLVIWQIGKLANWQIGKLVNW